MFAPDPIQEKRGYPTRIKWDISVRFKNDLAGIEPRTLQIMGSSFNH
jgi:hypothetical protein